uniref:Major facilitator superfamily (MFS) profile domain-containing protein n=1 Tax=Oryza nivara TaxID=4536 RepID=A0A0E0GI76_ORYNI
MDAAAAMEKQQQPGGEEEEEVISSVRYRGWKSMPYVIGNETFEKLGTIGTTANLLVYLTTVYHLPSVRAATLLNFFSGTTNLAPLLGAFLSDTFLGRYTTIAAASLASCLGMLVLTLTAAIPSLHPPPCTASSSSSSCQGPTHGQLAALLAAFAFLVVGAGGIRPCNLAFGADQFDPRTDSGRRGIASFFNWYYFTFTVAMMLSATLIIYLQSNVSWAIGLAVPAALMAISCALFFMGTRLYVRVRPEGSPFTSFARVIVAAVRKRRVPAPASADDLFDPPHQSKLVAKIKHTDQFRWLDKAAVVTAEDAVVDGMSAAAANPWRLCTVQQVEEVNLLAWIIPVWSSSIVYYVMLTQLGTYTVFQVMQSDRRVGRSGFEVPAGSMVVFNMVALTAWLPVYDRAVVPALRRVTGREEGITAIGLNELCYKESPESMRSVAGALSPLALAVASYASGAMVTAVERATGWLAQDIDKGRVDLFYLVVGAMSAANLAYFVVCALWYRSKNIADHGGVELLQTSSKHNADAPPAMAV